MTFKAGCLSWLGWKWDEGGLIDDNRLEFNKTWLEGIDIDQANASWHDEDRQLASGQVEDWDLTALPRTVFGETLYTHFERIKAILIEVTSTTGGTLEVGNCPIDPWSAPFGHDSHIRKVPPQSIEIMTNSRNGWDVTGLGVGSSSSSSSGEGEADFSTADRYLRVRAVGGTLTYSIAIVGIIEEASSSSSGS